MGKGICRRLWNGAVSCQTRLPIHGFELPQGKLDTKVGKVQKLSHYHSYRKANYCVCWMLQLCKEVFYEVRNLSKRVCLIILACSAP